MLMESNVREVWKVELLYYFSVYCSITPKSQIYRISIVQRIYYINKQCASYSYYSTTILPTTIVTKV